MIIRSLTRVSVPKCIGSVSRRGPIRGFRVARRYSSSSTANAAPGSSPQSQASMLATITSDLDRIAPRFEVESEQIQILKTPEEFYETLKSKITTARSRIYLSTLYIGSSEHDLISTIRHSLQTNPQLKVSFLTDALRGTRETPKASCASLLAPLISEFGPTRVEIRMFHTPNLTGLRKKYIPNRINEGWGLQHMKLYGTDDEIILSGANLSNDYFTNRQDRYHVFKSRELADYFHNIHTGVCNLSFDIQPADNEAGYVMSWPRTNPAPSPLDDVKGFKAQATRVLAPLLGPSNSPPRNPQTSKKNITTIHPTLSLVPLLPANKSTELPSLTTLLSTLSTPSFANSSWTFTAGYFNTTPQFRRLLLNTNPAHGTVLTAHPHANGFYGSKGVSGMLPSAYTYLARSFLRSVRLANLEGRIEMREWKRGIVGESGGWTYHAKGLWVSLPPPASESSSTSPQTPEESDPSITVLGSSNFTKRSYNLDLEANVVICTTDPQLQRRLGEEVKWLGEYAKKVDEEEFGRPERRVGVSVRLAMWAVRVLGGAL